MQVITEDVRIPLKVWAEGLDDEAMRQAKNLANLPFAVHHVSIMPDGHGGYGMPIGGVLATKAYVVPNAIGVDIGCVDADSEFLSLYGWKRIADYQENDPVMQYDPETGKGSYVRPSRFIVREQDDFYHLQTKYGINQRLTPDHKVLTYSPDGERCVTSAEDFVERHNQLKQGNKNQFETAFRFSQPDQGYYAKGLTTWTSARLRVAVMVAADAARDGGSWVLHLKKQRKIDRARTILQWAKISFTEHQQKDGCVTFRFRYDFPKHSLNNPYGVNEIKAYHWGWEADYFQLLTITEEVPHWDGSVEEQCFYTRNKEAADFYHYAFSATGRRAVLRVDDHYRDGTPDYRVFWYDETRVSMGSSPEAETIEKVPSTNGLAYCFQVPSGFWVMRRKGNIVMTGNCGMTACKTNIQAEWLKEPHPGQGTILKSVLNSIQRNVPTGNGPRGVHSHAQPLPSALDDKFGGETRSDDPQVLREAFLHSAKQLGTLGGGNHFIELDVDDSGTVWLMLHSGSRAFGYAICQHFNKIAKTLNERYFSEVSSKTELNFLALDSDEGKSYVRWMHLAQDWARYNRDLMLQNAMLNIHHVFQTVRPDLSVNLAEEIISTHHNYGVFEHHFGDDVFVTRKGAVRARVGDMVIIPGSMETGSYIAEGLGNPDSFMSSPHGAGRAMSRNKARAAFSVQDMVERLKDKDIELVTSSVKGVLDESGPCYKDIESVIGLSEDLVRPLYHLSPLGVLKGS